MVVDQTRPSGIFGARLRHTMLRVKEMDRSLAFYVDLIGMRLLRREDYATGRFTLAFVGFDDEAVANVIELTHNWDHPGSYDHGTSFGHIALGVPDLDAACRSMEAAGATIIRQPGPMAFGGVERIAFVSDPDGYRIELIEESSIG